MRWLPIILGIVVLFPDQALSDVTTDLLDEIRFRKALSQVESMGFVEENRGALNLENGNPELRNRSLTDLIDEFNARNVEPVPVKLVDVVKTSDDVRDRARSVCAVVEKGGLHDLGEGRYRLLVDSAKILNVKGIGANAMWAPSVKATAFLVAPSIVATAAHYVKCAGVDQLQFVFDYRVDTLGNVNNEFDHSQVYSALCILGYVFAGNDWALISLKREVEPDSTGTRPALALEVPEEGDSVYVLGHPFGLPTQYAGMGSVTDAPTNKSFITTTLYTFPHNSGSPVFREDGSVIGLNRGQDHCDTVEDDGAIGCELIACAATDGQRECQHGSSYESKIDDAIVILQPVVLESKSQTPIAIAVPGDRPRVLSPDAKVLQHYTLDRPKLLILSKRSDGRSYWEEFDVQRGSKYAIRETGFATGAYTLDVIDERDHD